jgi:hypothetical protein
MWELAGCLESIQQDAITELYGQLDCHDIGVGMLVMLGGFGTI